MEGGNVFCAMLQAAADQAAKSTTKSGKGTVSTNVADYKDKDLQGAFANATVTTSVLLELITYRKRRSPQSWCHATLHSGKKHQASEGVCGVKIT